MKQMKTRIAQLHCAVAYRDGEEQPTWNTGKATEDYGFNHPETDKAPLLQNGFIWTH